MFLFVFMHLCLGLPKKLFLGCYKTSVYFISLSFLPSFTSIFLTQLADIYHIFFSKFLDYVDSDWLIAVVIDLWGSSFCSTKSFWAVWKICMKLDVGGNHHTIIQNAKVTVIGVSLTNINLNLIFILK